MRRVVTVAGVTLWEHGERYYVRLEEAQVYMLDRLADEVIAAALADSLAQDGLSNDGDELP